MTSPDHILWGQDYPFVPNTENASSFLEHHHYSEEFFKIATQNDRFPHFDPETGVLTFLNGLPMPLGWVIQDRLLSLGELRIKEMDANGLDVAVLSTSAEPELIQGEVGIALARNCNDGLRDCAEVSRTVPWLCVPTGV